MAQGTITAIVTDLQEVQKAINALIGQVKQVDTQITQMTANGMGNASINDVAQGIIFTNTYSSATGIHFMRKQAITMLSGVDMYLSLTE